MSLYTTLASLSQTPGSNAADGSSDAPSTIDNQLNLLASFIAQLRDGVSGPQANEFRLTLTSALPVTASDVTGATTIYCTPYKGNRIGLYTGTQWQLYTSSEFSLALGTLTSGRPYDVFCYVSGGNPALEFAAWTSDTARATALVYQDGVLVKSGATTRRYLGTFYTTAATTTEDSEANRYLWNYYHRLPRSMKRVEATATWNYSTAAWRQANGSTSNQLNFVRGVAEDSVSAVSNALAVNSTALNRNMATGVGLDSTTTPSGTIGYCATNNIAAEGNAAYSGIPSAGRHFLAWLEKGDGADTQSWFGTGGYFQAGIVGEVLA